MTNYQHFLIMVLCEVQLLRTGFKEYIHPPHAPLEHLGHAHSQEGYAQRSSRGWNIQFNAKLYRKRPWLRRSEEQRSKQQMPFAISGPVLVAGWLNAGWTEWGGKKDMKESLVKTLWSYKPFLRLNSSWKLIMVHQLREKQYISLLWESALSWSHIKQLSTYFMFGQIKRL